ncbi:MAG: carbohydrate ABC transporter permease [Defluviitaleaceae bacterium]|nr:carbohydrate ABC transporter permease [Defluviitaleaceae bacterium]MCL2239726.1 carbohydrate ABC transporter permease [Defluviitaleaceae bacterium]
MVTRHNKIWSVVKHAIVLGFGFIMVYPLLWMLMSSFEVSDQIFHRAGLVPSQWDFTNYPTGWAGIGRWTFTRFFGNSFAYALVSTFGAVLSSSVIAYSFSRGNYPGRKILFAIMLGTLLLPGQVLMVPQYLWFHSLGWVGTYLPLVVPAFFGGAFFIFLMTNFMNAIPRELDESAKIDGCSFYGIYAKIIIPLSVPSLVTAGLFSFIWRWDDFMGPLLYVQGNPRLFPVTLALRVFADPTTVTDWGAFFAMSVLSLVPAVLIFIFFQRYLVEGISTTGLKG